MYLKSVKIQNFRKFGTENNTVIFASNSFIHGKNILNSTLIIGQNNSGKTSLIKALQKICGEKKEAFSFTDFNYYYLRDLLSTAIRNLGRIETYINDPSSADDDLLKFVWSVVPVISLTFEFAIDLADDSQDMLTNIGYLIVNDIPEDGSVSCALKYETENLFPFVKGLFDIAKREVDIDEKFSMFISIIKRIVLNPFVTTLFPLNTVFGLCQS